jgi:hypothetical protein
MATTLIIYQGNDQTILVTGLVDYQGNLLTTANLTGAIVNSEQESILALSFSPVEGQPGNYSAPIPAENVPALGQYAMTISGTAGDWQMFVKFNCIVTTRTI